ncbi:hypothetical protein VTJ83DRAFT_5493 [Remersonia thermophila]|uniref:Cation/H+ exchanger transmembrane domain-containing protein n=1 Tax=Remersonia thermophila TaxID=72144 RepID=A0ABR4D709_9PEZI
MAGGPAGNGTGAPPQAGVLEGVNPIEYSPSNPILLFIIQASIIIIFCQLLHYPLKLLRQPRVIAEVLGGIILGPTVMMRIPGFKDAIFPDESMPVFANVANLGLIIFLFLIALEVDMRMFTHNWKAALSVGLAGMVVPFGLGFAIAYGLYNRYHLGVVADPIGFGVFGLFIGTALSITAFPVLCRILSELNLLRTNVGVTTLAAGIGNDVTGWILLALCVALVNNSSGLAALWALLCCIGWTLLLVFVVRPPFMWILRRTGSLQNGPTQGVVALTMLMVLASAWFTGIIGVHPIFGAFLVGVICPHDGGFAIKLTEKIEDLIGVLFLPLYFALSGLNTNLGLLSDGVAWAYVVGVTCCAFFGKIIGGTIAARANRLLWRESITIGCLMSCKGLVELIVLNIGLQAGILSPITFSMFVVMALVTTVATTPLTKVFYPSWYQKKVERWRRGEIDWNGDPIDHPESGHEAGIEKPVESQIRRLMVHLRLDSLPSIFTFINLLSPDSVSTTPGSPDDKAEGLTPKQGDAQVAKKRPLEVHGLRVIELSDRTSSVMHLTSGEDFYSLRDPVVNAFRAFSQLHDLAVSGTTAVVPIDSYAETLVSHASDVSSDFALIPWGEGGGVSEEQSFPTTPHLSERFMSATHLELITQTLDKASRTCNAGIFIDNGFGGTTKPVDRPGLDRTRSALSIRSHRQEMTALPVVDKSHHVLLPFFGGPDDMVAMRLVLQLAKNRHVTASVVRIVWGGAAAEVEAATACSSPAADRTTKAPATTTWPRSSEATETHAPASQQDEEAAAFFSTMQASLPTELASRVAFGELHISSPGAAVMEIERLAQRTVGRNPKNAGDLVVLGRRNFLLESCSLAEPVAGGGGSGSGSGNYGTLDLQRAIGPVADRMVKAGPRASILVVQAGAARR